MGTTENMETHLRQNAYPGRGIVMGKNSQGQWTQVYWIMGRSTNSRNRIFVYEDNILRTEAADPTKLEDPSLIIYQAMLESNQQFVVSNGTQTTDIHNGLFEEKTFQQCVFQQQHEPDAPNFTPRISGLIDLNGTQPPMQLSIVRKSAFQEDQSEHLFFCYASVAAGSGYGITTYEGDGNPLPSFNQLPLHLPLQGDAPEIAKMYWEALDAENRVALAVKTIDPAAKQSSLVIFNQHAS